MGINSLNLLENPSARQPELYEETLNTTELQKYRWAIHLILPVHGTLA